MLSHEAEHMMANKQYKESADAYKRMLRELPGSYNIKFRIGYSYFNAPGMTSEAVSYLEKASANVSVDTDPGSLRDESAPVDCFLLLGHAYQRNNQFDEAGEAYNRFKDLLPDDDPRQRIADQYIRSIEQAKFYMDNPLALERSNLGREINSNVSNVNAVLSGDGQTMAYTNISRRGFEVFVVRKGRDGWGRPGNISRQLRRDFLLTSGLSYDGTELYLIYYVPDRSDIYYSSLEGNEWNRARKIRGPVNSRYNETHASVSGDGQTLYFTSDRDGGYGGLDIYSATFDRRGRWRDVTNLGPEINTPFNEETPFVTTDGKYLFFSSEGHSSMGGYDVFYVDLENPSEVHNLGYPVNNTGDNLFYFPVGDGRQGYMSFYDKDGFGQNDIYLLKILDYESADAEYEHVLHEDFLDVAAIMEITDEPADLPLPDDEEQLLVEESGLLATETETEKPVYRDEITKRPDLYDPAADNSFSVQFIALEREVEAGMMNNLSVDGSFLHYGKDGLNRFISGYYDTRDEALDALPAWLEKGYTDAFIRENNYIPNYTIQLAATRNFISLTHFIELSEIICKRGTDGLYRYSWGYFATYEDALSYIEQVRTMGYSDAFIRRM